MAGLWHCFTRINLNLWDFFGVLPYIIIDTQWYITCCFGLLEAMNAGARSGPDNVTWRNMDVDPQQRYGTRPRLRRLRSPPPSLEWGVKKGTGAKMGIEWG
jgi:hypothetical protein